MKDRHIYNFSRENFVPTNRETSTQASGMKVPNGKSSPSLNAHSYMPNTVFL